MTDNIYISRNKSFDPRRTQNQYSFDTISTDPKIDPYSTFSKLKQNLQGNSSPVKGYSQSKTFNRQNINTIPSNKYFSPNTFFSDHNNYFDNDNNYKKFTKKPVQCK